MKSRISRYMGLFVLGFAITMIGAPSTFAEYGRTLRSQMQVRFTEPIQVPGAILQPGLYVFQLEPSRIDRQTVQIFREYPNGSEKLVATAETDWVKRPVQKAKSANYSVVTTYAVPAGDPQVLDTWFTPGSIEGHQFVYGEQEAIQLARLNDQMGSASGHQYVGTR
jgi:hypothetical protein